MFVAIAFTVTTLVGSPSQAFAASGTPALDGVSGKTELLRDLYAMPSELGSLVSLWKPSEGTPAQDFIVLIQDAHANPEGQANVAGILHYLGSKSPALFVGLEGAAGELHPEYLDLFKEFPEANRAVIGDLKRKGELNGAEQFLLGQHRETGNKKREVKSFDVTRSAFPEVVVSGVEDAKLYRDNLRTFLALLSRRDEIQTLLNPVRTQLEKESSQKLNGELRDFLKERNRRKEGRFNVAGSPGNADLQAYVRYLQKQVSKTLEIDLKDPIEQLRFPSLMRLVKIDEVRMSFSQEKAKSEWAKAVASVKASAQGKEEKEFAKALTAFAQDKGFIEGEGGSLAISMDRSLYPRKMLEGLFRFAKQRKLSFAGQEAFWQSWKLVVFQAEINVTELLSEMDMLEEALIQKLAKTDEEKALVRRLNGFDLLEKMLRLELSRGDYDKVLSGQEALRSFAADSKNLEGFIDQAYHFYEVSLERDETLVSNLLSLAQKGGNGKTPLMALYSGGFHTPGVEEQLRAKNIGYAVFSPRLTKTDHGEMYEKVMSGANADLTAYFKVKNPFATKQEALIFKQLIETAAPVLVEKYQLKPDQVAARVAQAVKENPVLSEVVTAEPAQDTASVRFEPRSDLQSLIPQNSSVMPEPVLGNRAELRTDKSNVAGAARSFLINFASGVSSAFRSKAGEIKATPVDPKMMAIIEQFLPLSKMPGQDPAPVLGHFMSAGQMLGPDDQDGVPVRILSALRKGDLAEARKLTRNLIWEFAERKYVEARYFQRLSDLADRLAAMGLLDAQWLEELKPVIEQQQEKALAWQKMGETQRIPIVTDEILAQPTAQGDQKGVRSEIRSAPEIAQAFKDRVYVTGEFPEGATHLSFLFNQSLDYLTAEKDLRAVFEALEDGNVRIARIILIRLIEEWIGGAVAEIHPQKFPQLERFIAELLSIGMLDQAGVDSLTAKIAEKNARMKSETQPIMIPGQVKRSEARTARAVLQSFLSTLPSSPTFHPFEAFYISRIADRLKDIHHSVVTIFDLDDTLWDSKYRPKVYLMPSFLESLQANGHMAGVISDKLILVDDVTFSAQKLAEISEADRSKILIEHAKNSQSFRENVSEPLSRLGITMDDFDFFSLGIMHEGQIYRYIRLRDKKDPAKEPVEMLFPFSMDDPAKNIPQASKLFAAKLVDLYMQQYFGRKDLTQAHLIMVGDHLKADHLAMAKKPLMESDGPYHQRLFSFMAQDEVGQRPIFGNGRSHVIVPKFEFKDSELKVGFGLSDLGVVYKVEDSFEEGTLLADIPRTVLRAIEDMGKEEQEENLFVVAPVSGVKRAEMRADNLAKFSASLIANPVLTAGSSLPGFLILRSEMRSRPPMTRSTRYAEGQATRPGQVVGQASFFSPSLTEEILFPSISLVNMRVEETSEVLERLDELISRAEAGIRQASKGVEQEQALELMEQFAAEIREDWERIQESLESADKDVPPFAEGSRMSDPFGLLIRKIRERRETDASRQNPLNLLLDQVRAAALTLSRSDIDPEAELASAEQVMSSKLKRFQAVIQEKAVAQQKFAKVLQKLGTEQGFEEAGKEMKQAASADGGIEDIVNMMVEDFLRNVHDYYFGTPEAREKTLQRMSDAQKGFNAIFYDDVMFGGAKEIKQLFSGNSVFQFRRKMSADPTMKKVANEIISVADDLLAAIREAVGRTSPSYELEGGDSEEGTVLVVRDFMGASKAVDLWENHGHRIKAIVTDAATFTTHWVVYLKGVANPPLILIIDDEKQRKQLDAIKPGEKILVAVDPETGAAKVYLEPTSDQVAEAEQETRRLAMLNRAQQRQNSLRPGRIGIYANVSPGETSGIRESGADGTGLTRTEIDAVAEGFMIRMARLKAAGKEEEFLREAERFQKHLEQSYEAQSKDPSLNGKANTWRAFDLWPDKNVDLFDVLKELQLPDKPGFDFFREPLGAEILKRQIAAFMAIEARLGDLPVPERAVTRLMFPHVNGAEDARYLDEEILPDARRYAANALGTDRAPAMVHAAEIYIQYGAMIETPEAVDHMKEILGYRTAAQTRLFRFVSVGTNDMEIRLLSDWMKVKLSRDYPWVARFLKKLYPLYLKQYEKIIRRVKEFNDDPQNVLPGEARVAVGFCGEVAGTDAFLSFLQDQDDRYNGEGVTVPLSASMSSSQIHHAKTLLRLPVDPGLRALFDQGTHESEAKPDDGFNQKVNALVSVRVHRAENALLFIEQYQERYEMAGLENVMYRTDMDVISGIGSFGDFEFIKEMLEKLEGVVFDPEGTMSASDLEKMLEILSRKNITVPVDNAEIRVAFEFLSQVRDVWLSLAKTDPDKHYAGKLTPALAPLFVGAFTNQPWQEGIPKEQWVSEFYRHYYRNAAVAFRTVSHVLTHYAKEVVPQKVLEAKRYEAAGLEGTSFGVNEQLIEGPIFFMEHGLAYGTYRFLDLEEAGDLLVHQPARVMDFLRYTAEKFGEGELPRIGSETQKSIRQNREAFAGLMMRPSPEREALYRSFSQLMALDAPLGYAVSRLNGFRLNSVLIPGFQEILYRFLDHSRFYPLHTQTVRAFNVMERLPEQDSFIFSQAAEIYQGLREEPSHIQSLRLAVLLMDIVRYRWTKQFGDQAAPGSIQSVDDEWVRGQVSGILSAMGFDGAVMVRDVSWLISQNIRLGLKDLLYSQELAEELLSVVNSLKKAKEAGMDSGEAENLLDMLYVIRFVQRYAAVAPEKQVLLTQQGFNAPLPNHDKFYLYAKYLLASEQSYELEELANIIHHDYEKSKKRESPAFSGFDRFTESGSLVRKLKEVAASPETWNAYCEGVWPSRSIQGIIEGGFEALRLEVLEPDFQSSFDTFLTGVTPYRAKSLDAGELVREWVLLRHLQSLPSLKDKKRVQETVLTLFEPLQKVQGVAPVPYRVVLGTGYEDSDLERIYARVLFERGFDIVKIWTNRFVNEGEEQGPMMTVAVGFFTPKPHVPMARMLQEMREDLAKIFQVKHVVNSHLSQFFSPSARRMTNRSEKMDELYGPLTVRKPQGVPDFRAQVLFLEDREAASVLQVTALDRPGLLAMVFAILEEHYGFRITDPRSDDDEYVRSSFFVSERQGGEWAPVSDEKKAEVAETLRIMLDAEKSVVKLGGELQTGDAEEARAELRVSRSEARDASAWQKLSQGGAPKEFAAWNEELIKDLQARLVRFQQATLAMAAESDLSTMQFIKKKPVQAKDWAALQQQAASFLKQTSTVEKPRGYRIENALIERETPALWGLLKSRETHNVILITVLGARSEMRAGSEKLEDYLAAIESSENLGAEIQGTHPFREMAAYWEKLNATQVPIDDMILDYRDLTDRYGAGRYAGVDPRTLINRPEDWEDIFHNKILTLKAFLQLWREPSRRLEFSGDGIEEENYRKAVAAEGRDTLLLARLRQLLEDPAEAARIQEAFSRGVRSETRAITTVLVVDDEKSIRFTAAAFLSAAGYQVQTAESGVKALEMVKFGTFDAVLSDITMPGGVSGVDLAKHFQGRGPRVVLMTGENASREEFSKLQEDGIIDGILQKPAAKEVILEAVRKLTPREGLGVGRDRLTQLFWSSVLGHLYGNKMMPLSMVSSQSRQSTSMVPDLLKNIENIPGVLEKADRFFISRKQGMDDLFFESMEGFIGDELLPTTLTLSPEENVILKEDVDWPVLMRELQEISTAVREARGRIEAMGSMDAASFEQRIRPELTALMATVKTKLNGIHTRLDAAAAKISPVRAEMREVSNPERIANLLRHDLNGKIQVLMSADFDGVASKESLREAVRETLVVFRIFDLEQFQARGGELFIPEGNDRIFAYRIPSTRSEKIYQTAVYGAAKRAKSYEPEALRQIAEEVGFEKIKNDFAPEVKELENVRDELAQTGDLKPALRSRIAALGETIREKMKDWVAQWTVATAPSVTVPRKEIQRVLVVDDEDIIRKMLAMQLRSFGYTVMTASNGREALEKVRSEGVDLVLSDITMPEMNGRALAQKIREEGMATAVILMSGYSADPNDEDFLTKPFSADDLKEAIRKISSRSEVRAYLFSSLPKVERPLDMPEEYAVRVRKIFIFGPKGIGYEKLGEDAILYVLFVEQMLKKFPNAEVHIAIDYPNLFSRESFKGRVFPVEDPSYESKRHEAEGQEAFEPQEGILTHVQTPPGVILEAAELMPEKLAGWIQESQYDMVFDFFGSGSGLQTFFQKAPGIKKPLIFSNMNTVVQRISRGEESQDSPVIMMDASGLRVVQGTEQVGNMTRAGTLPGYWEKTYRVYRALGLYPERFDLQQLNGLGVSLSDVERRWVLQTLKGMFLKKQQDPQAVMNGNEKFIYVNIFAQGTLGLVSEGMWIELLSGILERQDVYLIFSQGGFMDRKNLPQLASIMHDLAQRVGPSKARFLLEAPENLSVGRVQEIMQTMDFVITLDTGFSHLATALNVPQVEFMTLPKSFSQWGTYRKNSLIVDHDFLEHLFQNPKKGYQAIQGFVRMSLAATDAPRRRKVLEFVGPPAPVTEPGRDFTRRSELRTSELTKELFAKQGELFRPYERGQRHIGVNALSARIRDLESHRQRWISSKDVFLKYRSLENMLNQMWRDMAAMQYVRADDIDVASRAVAELLAPQRGLTEEFRGALTRVQNDLERWGNAKRRQAEILNLLGDDAYKRFEGENAQDYIRDAGKVWLIALPEVAGEYKYTKPGFYDVVRTKIWPAVNHWMQEPLSAQRLDQAKKDGLDILAKWHHFERLPDGTLEDNHPRADVIGEDGLGSRLRRQLFIFWEGLNIMVLAAETLMPRAEVVAAVPQAPVAERTPAVPQYIQGELFPRSELRLAATEAYKKSLAGEVSAAEPFFVPAEIIETAEQLEIYSAPDIAAELEGGVTESNIRKARLWITLKLLQAIRDSKQEGQVANERLQQFLDQVMASVPDRAKALAASETATGPKFHVNLAGLSEGEWSEFVANFPVVLGMLVTLRASLSINVDLEGEALAAVQKKFDDLMAREGVKLGAGQLRLVSTVRGDKFKSFEGQKEADAFMARDERLLRRRKNVRSYWITEDANRMDALAAGIATALLEVASDEHLDAIYTYKPSHYASMLATVMNAIQGYLQIRTAA